MREALHVAADTPLRQALALMTARHETAVVLVEGGVPTGLFTERDAVRACLESDIDELLVGQTVEADPLTAVADAELVDAYRAMLAAGVRHLLVVDGEGLLIGVVEESDLVAHFGIEHFAHLDPVSRLMSRSVVTLGPRATMRELARQLRRHAIGSVVIEKNRRPVGIVTVTDLTRALADGTDLDAVRLESVMSSHLVTADADESVFAAAQRMRGAGVRHLVVVRAGRAIGMLTEHDVVQTMESGYSDVLRRIIGQQAQEIESQRRRLSERGLIDQLLTRSHGLGLVMVAAPGRVTFANAAARKLLGASESGGDDLEALLAGLSPGNRDALLALAAAPPLGEQTLRIVEPACDIGVRAIGIDVAGGGAGLSGLMLVLNDETLAERTEELLEFNQHVVREMPHMVIWVDAAGDVVHANAAVHRTLGEAPGALLGRSLRDIFAQCPSDHVTNGLERLQRSGNEVFRSELRASDGRRIPVEVYGSRLSFRGRDYYGGFIRDLTDQHVVERALEDAEQRLLALVQASPDYIAVQDGEGRWQMANRSGLAMFGLEQVDYQGLTDEELAARCPRPFADSLARGARTSAQAWQEGKPLRAIHALPDGDGSTRYLDMIKVPIFDDQGRRKALVVIGRDVTERIRAERERDASDERLRTAVAAMDDLLLVLDAAHRLVDHFPRDSEALRLHSPDPPIGKPIDAVLPAHVAALYEQAVEALGSSGKAQGFDYALSTADGGERWFSARLSARSDRVAAAPGYTLVIRDISDRKQAEAQVREINESLEERVAERTSEMQAALSELESFSYSISHDLRTPLRAIEGFGRLLETDYGDRLDDVGRDYLSRVRLAAQRMAGLIDDLLDLARVSRKNLQKQEVDISAMAHEVAQEIRERQPWRNVTISIEPRLNGRADPVLLRVVLDNLIGNAWKFTGGIADATIRVGRERHQGRDWFFVRDNGAGFDMAYADRLFKPFQRLHAMSEFEGTGIGLATILRIVTRHGGQVQAEGRPGEGACFRFSLGDGA